MQTLFKRKKLLIVILVLLLIIVAITKINQQIELDNLQKERARLEAEKERLELLRESLKEELSNASNPQYLESLAQKKLRMVRPDEMIFIIREN